MGRDRFFNPDTNLIGDNHLYNNSNPTPPTAGSSTSTRKAEAHRLSPVHSVRRNRSSHNSDNATTNEDDGITVSASSSTATPPPYLSISPFPKSKTSSRLNQNQNQNQNNDKYHSRGARSTSSNSFSKSSALPSILGYQPQPELTSPFHQSPFTTQTIHSPDSFEVKHLHQHQHQQEHTTTTSNTSSSSAFFTPQRPRRRVSLSVNSQSQNVAVPIHYPSPRSRARTMSFNIRSTSSSSSLSRRHHHDDRPKSTRTRKIVITLLVLLSLVLIGTVVVLSSVSYYLGIPSWAYLTESEVSWRPQDVIKQLQDPSLLPTRRTTLQRRQDWAEVSEAQVESATAAVEGIMGTDALPESWKELEQEMEELDAADESEELPSYDDSVEAETATETETTNDIVTSASEESENVWGIDGQGSGGYWMQKDWDGRVHGADSWERLYNVTTRPGETIPRLIHQTWKSDQLPEKWQKAWKECREGMPDYEYMLWTDDLAREFIAKHYPAHLHMFETYKYPIQRADSIRYFILHHFGGVYMDLDIGCRRRLDPLLQGDWEVILPITKPVGVSNDLIFSSKGSAFMDDTIHGLSTFNHQYFTNYPTVMFSTGPMFLSAQYALYSSAHPLTETHPRAEVRILPKSLYGKNAPMSTVPHSFFSHFYGSSWHSDDAGFITFLGSWGKGLMWVGLVVIVLGAIRLIWVKRKGAVAQQYQLLSILPTTSNHGTTGHRSGASSPTSSSGSNGPMSPSSTYEMGTLPNQLPSDIASVFKRAGNLILAAPATLLSGDRDRDRRGRKKTGLLYFVPALFQPGPMPRSRGRTASEASQLPLRRPRKSRVPPPPYEQISNETPRSRSPTKMSGGGSRGLEGDSTMDEVDAFLHEADTEGESSNYADAEVEADADGDGDGDDQSEREWAAWGGKANERT